MTKKRVGIRGNPPCYSMSLQYQPHLLLRKVFCSESGSIANSGDLQVLLNRMPLAIEWRAQTDGDSDMFHCIYK